MNLLEVKNLRTSFYTDEGIVQAVRGVSLRVAEGETIGIVGESGCGKSVSMMSIINLLPDNALIEADKIIFNGEDISKKRPEYYRKLRGDKIGMIFQDSMTSLNPLLTIEKQLTEPLRIHQKMNRVQASNRALEMLKMVEISNPKERLKQYPHELSGGMRQRVMIAIALSCNPMLLIADEPTTALDVTISAQILELMKQLQKKLSTSIILITHDLGVVANMCSYIYVIYAGVVVEEGPIYDIFKNTSHPYTKGLLNCIPSSEVGERKNLEPILGTPPDLIKPPIGCPFTSRCNVAMRICEKNMPEEYEVATSHFVRCHLYHPFLKESLSYE